MTAHARIFCDDDLYTEYADVFSFLFRLFTLKLLGLEMYVYIMIKCQLLLR